MNKGNVKIMGSKNAWHLNPRAEFPLFDGLILETGSRSVRYFSLCRILDNQKVDLASTYLQGKAEVWYRSCSLTRKNVSWEDFVVDIYARFGDEMGSKSSLVMRNDDNFLVLNPVVNQYRWRGSQEVKVMTKWGRRIQGGRCKNDGGVLFMERVTKMVLVVVMAWQLGDESDDEVGEEDSVSEAGARMMVVYCGGNGDEDGVGDGVQMAWQSGDEGDQELGEEDSMSANGDEDVDDGRRRVLGCGRVERRNKRRWWAHEGEVKGVRGRGSQEMKVMMNCGRRIQCGGCTNDGGVLLIEMVMKMALVIEMVWQSRVEGDDEVGQEDSMTWVHE
ncbi:hypothetical protein Cgig2_011319 [Carnegiea gigantea]|uniref:Retrotransposon gag domain-containing protein n=1 Tax=Carnegiea gigantea TaxID=171969 RepID=A0A9Q1KEQ7_9CARY|nr:hypothetical protein Cgig2_011319 [Carnegiea gigantea]